jgi:hypothetical protein
MDYGQITIRAEVTIEEGKIEEYKKLIQQMSGVVAVNEPNTINYKFFLNRDATKCIVFLLLTPFIFNTIDLFCKV